MHVEFCADAALSKSTAQRRRAMRWRGEECGVQIHMNFFVHY